MTALATAPSAAWTSADNQGRSADRPGGQHGHGSGRERRGGERVPVGPRSWQRGKQAARLDLTGVDHDRAGNQNARVRHIG